MDEPTAADSPVVALRRANLRRWIDTHHRGRQADFIRAVAEARGVELNGGELSSLLRNKAFGERRARALERAVGMPEGYLDTDPDSSWPFQRVQLADLARLSPAGRELVESMILALLQRQEAGAADARPAQAPAREHEPSH